MTGEDVAWIVTSYGQAKNKKKQIRILSQLYVVSQAEICRLLTENGVELYAPKETRRDTRRRQSHISKERICIDCGKTFLGDQQACRCPECKMIHRREYQRAYRR